MSRTLLESVQFADLSQGERKLKVDRTRNVIEGVKILGNRSLNHHGERSARGSRYTPNALAKAAKLYEGMAVNANHNPRNDLDRERSVFDPFGKLRNCRVEGDGVYGDLHYAPNHDVSKLVLDDVECELFNYGLSHNAVSCRDWIEDGCLVIDDLTKVRSVDLVTRPATVRNLMESQEMPSTLRSILESVLPKLRPNAQTVGRNLLEDDGAYMSAPTEEVPPPDPDEALATGFRTALYAVVDSVIAKEMEPKAGLAKIKELFDAHFKLASDAPAETESTEEKPAEKPVTESVASTTSTAVVPAQTQDELAALRAKDQARDLCESLGVIPTKVQLKSLLAPGLTDTEKRELVESFRPKGTTAGPRSAPPRAPSNDPPGKPAIGTTAADQIAFLRHGR
jgi:hypothetical protein